MLNSKANGTISLKKRFDLKLEEVKAAQSDLQLEEEEEEMNKRM